MNAFFVASTGTDIGKTLLMTALCWQLTQQGKKITALKPIVSGFSDEDENSDSARILRSCGLEPTLAQIERISPWRYRAALAPNMAAKADDKPPVAFDPLFSFCRQHESSQADVLLVEGVGGIMTPLNDTHTVLDWIKTLDWPVLLVAGSYLGAISHTLTALEALRQRHVRVNTLFVSESAASPVSLVEMVGALKCFTPPDLPVIALPRVAAASESWKEMPPISRVCDHE